jgi:hypothetical protein
VRVAIQSHYEELSSLLSMPDPPELEGRRGHRLTQPGDPRRREKILLPLLVRWAQWRCLDVDPSASSASEASTHVKTWRLVGRGTAA